jgi:competence protein CoiA
LLTANTRTGKRISLGYQYNKETLLVLRRNEEFICPVCGEEVTLKLGEHRIYHFAHQRKENCREVYERETEYHMNGKLQLYQWLIGQRIRAILEYYDSDTQQRPDIMFEYNGNKYALEYQCSPIPEDQFISRTINYFQHGYIPLWIAGNKLIKTNRKNIYTLSCFTSFFLQTNKVQQFFIPSYCPEHRLLHFTGPLLTLSPNNAFAHNHTFPINDLSINSLFEPILTKKISTGLWNREIEKSNFNWFFHPNPKQKQFLQEIYRNNLNLFLLPSEIGLPVSHSPLVSTPPTIWQTYLFLDVLLTKSPGEYIPLLEFEKSFNRRVRKKDIVIRNLPQFEQINPFIAVKEYILLLESLGMVSILNDTAIQLNTKLMVPRSNQEKEELKRNFLQKNHTFFLK